MSFQPDRKFGNVLSNFPDGNVAHPARAAGVEMCVVGQPLRVALKFARANPIGKFLGKFRAHAGKQFHAVVFISSNNARCSCATSRTVFT